jgi:GAF domain-containing protein/HAMP domain-containing protein
MMRATLFNPASWSLTARITAGLIFLAIIISPVVLASTIQSVQQVNEQVATSLISEVGARQMVAISSALNTADTAIRRFRTDESSRLYGLMLAQVNVNEAVAFPRATVSQVSAIMRERLLALPISLFENVRLVDRNGRVLAQASRSTPLPGDPVGPRSPAYIAGVNAALRGEDRVLSVAQIATSLTPIVEHTEVLRWRDGEPLGYLIVRLNNRRVFLDQITLPPNANPFNLTTFLTAANGTLIIPGGATPQLLRTANSLAVDRALDGGTGTSIYTAGDGVEYLGYYTRLTGPALALVTQVPLEAARTRIDADLLPRRIALVIGVLIVMALSGVLISQWVTPTVNRLRRSVQTMAFGNLDVEVPDTDRRDELGALANNIETLRDQVRGQIQTLETSIAARVRDLDATQEISRFAATERDLQRLMDDVVNLIIKRFENIYHAQIFLIDADGQDALLRASTGDVGRELLRRGHRLGVGSVSVIGQVTSQGRLVLARDTAMSQVHKRNEFLPDTRAELAVPLRVGANIIGALDVQSRERDAFNEEQVETLQTMADQIAVAIENARLYEEVNRRLADIEERNRGATMRAWQEFMRSERQDVLTRDAGIVTEYQYPELGEAAMTTGELVVGRVTPRQTIPIAVPVMLRQQVLGIVEWEIPVGALSEDRLELARELASRLAISLDNARLFQESQRRAERERVVNEIVARLTAQNNINDILQTAVREVGQALRVPVSIRIGLDAPASGNGTNGVHPSETSNGQPG